MRHNEGVDSDAPLRHYDQGIDIDLAEDPPERNRCHPEPGSRRGDGAETAGQVADRAVQILGGRGYMRENVAERLYREVRVNRIWEGASEIQREIIAAQVLKRGVDRWIG